MLTEINFAKGFLVDEDLMGGVTADPEKPGSYVAFVLRHTTGEYLGYAAFSELSDALQAINQIPRSWGYEALGGCGNGNCGGGACKKGGCGKSCGPSEAPPEPTPKNS